VIVLVDKEIERCVSELTAYTYILTE
jgi:hypothetical protein